MVAIIYFTFYTPFLARRSMTTDSRLVSVLTFWSKKDNLKKVLFSVSIGLIIE